MVLVASSPLSADCIQRLSRRPHGCPACCRLPTLPARNKPGPDWSTADFLLRPLIAKHTLASITTRLSGFTLWKNSIGRLASLSVSAFERCRTLYLNTSPRSLPCWNCARSANAVNMSCRPIARTLLSAHTNARSAAIAWRTDCTSAARIALASCCSGHDASPLQPIRKRSSGALIPHQFGASNERKRESLRDGSRV
jgi:hypothetical protein